MKTPEDIKKGLKHCSEIGCMGCPYHDQDCSPHNPFQKCADDALTYIQQLEERSPVDAEPVRHGEWIKGGYVCGDNEWKCSVCGKTEWTGSADWMKFCMYCGAKMDLGEQANAENKS